MYTGVMCSSVLEKGQWAITICSCQLVKTSTLNDPLTKEKRKKKEDHKSHRITFRLVYDNLELFYKSVSLT